MQNQVYLTTHHQRDTETEWDYRGARFYDNVSGRFLGADPLADKFRAWSSYNYTLGNPIRFIDSDGMAEEDCSGREVWFRRVMKSKGGFQQPIKTNF